ncbi:MAG: hypothetical protein H8E82_06750, partial [Candidatus Marinimicrobia bacterium]|nr:hypothetical protein [Candidatus Neomarinimicrobiota bacterium]
MIIYKKYLYTTVILKLHRNLVTFLMLNFAFLVFTACPDTPDEYERDTTIYLELESTGIFTANLRVGVIDTTDVWIFGLSRNDSIILTSNVTAPDTIVKDVGLKPATEYIYRAYFMEDGIAVDSSLEVTAITEDTTSHNFVWEIDTLGEYGSYLKDVAIIDENNVWVVGDIQEDGGPYGVAIWDLEQWSLKKLETETSNVRPRGIWAFSDNNIWFASGSIYHWDGNETTLEWLRDIGTGETVEKIWASSQSNIFFVGNEGTIVHYDGSGFERMESGTDTPLRDIWGLDKN